MSLGLVDIQRFFNLRKMNRHLRVFLNGYDVTGVFRWVNDETGEAEIVLTYDNGKAQLNEAGDGLLTGIFNGRVEFMIVEKKTGAPRSYDLPAST